MRIRAYLSERKSTGEVERSAATFAKKFLELKVDHPQFENVVIKHRLLISDDDLKIVFNPDASKEELSGVYQRASQEKLNAALAKDNLIEAMVEFVRASPLKDPAFAASYVTIRYERSAYQLRLPSVTGDPVDVQITVDNRISLHDGHNGMALSHYPGSARVIEVKVPLKYSQFTDANLKEVPDLKIVQTLIEQLDARIITGFEPNSGKLSNTLRLAE